MADTLSHSANGNGAIYSNGHSNGSANGAANGKPNYESVVDRVANGPVSQAAQDQVNKTANEFANLNASRKATPGTAATSQRLTHYHSYFFDLLAWKNPRASGIVYASLVSLIFAARYLDVIRYFFKLTWLALGTTVAAEIVGKVVLGQGITSQLRPNKYFVVSRDTLDTMIGDVHELINFFVIEAQRILFAENIGASVAAFVAAFLSYYLVKIVPYWGLAILGTTAAFMIPLLYTSNQEVIDAQLKHASDLVNAQTAQVRDAANKHTAHVAELTKHAPLDETAFPSAPSGTFQKDTEDFLDGSATNAAPVFPVEPASSADPLVNL
ncbi:unnamed protein product [Parascedosporium putredinis]|uniref:Reticulon-like protein n=1 Tax=Parascedosporium putredinis TaxID=1442378 RepID=A0A9P1M6Z7_9PEZI|nr:unnamed protein product [Parascedosporium putredinis]CAI7990661.1 unnamed protein product [Parascedosporium putredinis]